MKAAIRSSYSLPARSRWRLRLDGPSGLSGPGPWGRGTYFAAAPEGAVVAGRYHADMVEDPNGPSPVLPSGGGAGWALIAKAALWSNLTDDGPSPVEGGASSTSEPFYSGVEVTADIPLLPGEKR